MITETIYVPNIFNKDGTRTIENELMALEGMKRVIIDLAAKRMTFSYALPATIATIKAKMEEIGYPMGEDLGIYPSKRKGQSAIKPLVSLG